LGPALFYVRAIMSPLEKNEIVFVKADYAALEYNSIFICNVKADYYPP
jgi:hypothetical protein